MWQIETAKQQLVAEKLRFEEQKGQAINNSATVTSAI